jgi:hypothetical protein
VNSQEKREAVRRTHDYRCGYCGVREEESGSELEIDHYRPRSVGGGDELENLVYCCPTCNRLKSDYWPAPQTADGPYFLNPRREDPDGSLVALTARGGFHLERLRLNRPPLVALRRARAEHAALLRELDALRGGQEKLRAQLAARDEEIRHILDELARLTGG